MLYIYEMDDLEERYELMHKIEDIKESFPHLECCYIDFMNDDIDGIREQYARLMKQTKEVDYRNEQMKLARTLIIAGLLYSEKYSSGPAFNP